MDSSGDVSLLGHLDPSQINCLNESNEHNLKSLLTSKSTTSPSYLLSDSDGQLLLSIPFNQTVRIRAIVFKTSNVSQGPRRIKLLINRPSLGFEDVEDADEKQFAQVLEVTEDQLREGKRILLRFVKFQSVNSLHIFVSSNQGDEDETRIDSLDIFGIVPMLAARDLSGLKNLEE